MTDRTPSPRIFVFTFKNEKWRIPARDRADAERVLCRAMGWRDVDERVRFVGEEEGKG